MSALTDLTAASKLVDAAFAAGGPAAWAGLLADGFVAHWADGTVEDAAAFAAAAGDPGRTSDLQSINLAGASFAGVTVTVSSVTPPPPSQLAPPVVKLTRELRTFVQVGEAWRLIALLVEPVTTTLPEKGGEQPAIALPKLTDFHGKPAAAAPPVDSGLRSTYSGAVVLSLVPRDALEPLIPEGLQLAAPLDPAQTMHPLLHMIGDQDEPCLFYKLDGGDLPDQVGTGYREMLMLIPLVQRTGDDIWYNFSLRMYLDNNIAVAGGNVIYGYGKQLALIDRSTIGDTLVYRTFSSDRATLYYEETIRQLPAPPGGAPPAGWQQARDLLAMPLVGAQPSDAAEPDQLVCSAWELDFSQAAVAPATSVAFVRAPFRDGMDGWVDTYPGMASRAFTVENVLWRLTLPPAPCGDY